MSLSKESIRRLRILKEAILAQPEYYRQEKWVSKIEGCDTTCCLSGWADFIFNGKKVHEERAKRLFDAGDPSYVCEEWQSVTSSTLGLTDAQVDLLTASPENWPYPFECHYYEATSNIGRAQVAADRIERFIKTGGEE